MIFKDDPEEYFFEVGGNLQFPSSESKGAHRPESFYSETEEPHEHDGQSKWRILSNQDSGDADFDVAPHSSSNKPKRTSGEGDIGSEMDSTENASGHLNAPISAVYFPQPELEPAGVLASEGEDVEMGQADGRLSESTIHPFIQTDSADTANKNQQIPVSMNRPVNINQPQTPKRDISAPRVTAQPPFGVNDGAVHSDIFDQLKGRFSSLSSTENMSKLQTKAMKPDTFSEPAASAAGEFASQGKNQAPHGSGPSINLQDFQAVAGETVTATGYRIISLSGHIEQDHKNVFVEFLDKLQNQGCVNLLLDMSKLETISSSGWGVLAAYLQRLKKQNGTIILSAMTRDVLQCFRVLELDKLFSYYTSVFDALRGAKQSQDAGNQAKLNQASPVFASQKPEIITHLPLEEKIRRIITENPDLSAREIGKQLKTDEYGNTSISLWSLQSKLREIGLGTKEERYRFFRSS